MTKWRRTGTLLAVGTIALAAAVGCGSSQASSSASSGGLAQYSGADRQDKLTASAKKEKSLVWYTTMIPDQLANPLAEAFKKKYPYIDVKLFRANSTQVAQRVTQEYRAGKHSVDVMDGTGTSSLLQAAGDLQPFSSPELAAYSPELKDTKGYWGTELQYFMTLGYNTSLVTRSEVPKTYQDLLDPKWKGKMAWSTSATSGAPTFIGNIFATMGEADGTAYLQQLSKQGIHNVDSSGRAVLDQALGGQFPIALQIFNDQAAFSKAKGAPVDWVALQPVYAQLSRISLAKSPPHPGAAMLFLDFMFSKAGQDIIRAGGGIPGRPDVDAEVATLKPNAGGFKAQYIDPDQVYRDTSKWTDLYKKLFM